MDLEYKLLGRNDNEGAVNCIAESFFKKDLLSVALGISFNDWVSFAKKEVQRSIEEGLSFGAFDRDEVVGAHLVYDFSNYNPDSYTSIDSFAPISKFMKELYSDYNVFGNILHFSYVGVLPDYSNKGIAYEMAVKNIDLAKEMNYEKIILEATSPYSQKNVSRLGFRKINEIFYKDFFYYGKRVFGDISKASSCMLMELEL